MGDVRKLIGAGPRFLQSQVGYLSILAELTDGPRKPRGWWRHQLPRLREAGFVQPATRVHGAWELTNKCRAILRALEGGGDEHH